MPEEEEVVIDPTETEETPTSGGHPNPDHEEH